MAQAGQTELSTDFGADVATWFARLGCGRGNPLWARHSPRRKNLAPFPELKYRFEAPAVLEVNTILVAFVTLAPAGGRAFAGGRENGRHVSSISELGFRISDLMSESDKNLLLVWAHPVKDLEIVKEFAT